MTRTFRGLISAAAILLLTLSSVPAWAQYLDWPIRTGVGNPPIQFPARVVQDYTCVGLNYSGSSGIDDSCVFPGTDKTLKYHTGMDIPAQSGSDGQYYAPAPGQIVELTGDCKAGATSCNHGQGNSIVIQHNAHLFTRVDHLASVNPRLAVSCAKNPPPNCTSSLARGDYLGVMGATGNVTGPHFHFETFSTYPTGKFGYDTAAPSLDSYQDPWSLIATSSIAPLVVVTRTRTMVRRGPDPIYSAMGYVDGLYTHLVASADANGWFRVHVPCIYGNGRSNDGTKYNACFGWVAASDLYPADSATPTLLNPQGLTYVAVPPGSSVNIRSTTNALLSANVVAQAPAGQLLAYSSVARSQGTDGCRAGSASWLNVPLLMKGDSDPSSGWICADAVATVGAQDQGTRTVLSQPGDLFVSSSFSTALAQTFTANKTGQLWRIDLGLTNTPGYYTVDLLSYADFRAMQPCSQLPCGNSDLRSSIFRTRVRGDGQQYFSQLQFNAPVYTQVELGAAGVYVTAGQKYAIVLRYEPTQGSDYGAWLFGESIANGELCFNNPYTGGASHFQCSDPLTATWDLMFRTWVR